MKRILKWVFFIVLMAAAILGVCMMTVNNHIVQAQKGNIKAAVTPGNENLSVREIEELKAIDPQCITVLGAGIRNSETPTPMLKDRLDTAIMLYNKKVAPKILLTGDNGSLTHNEIHVMLKYTLKKGIPSKDIFCDHAGFSTYDSMYRAKSIFRVKRMVVVSQTYHLYRALYLANKLRITAVGAGADQETYSGQQEREIREVLARNKDYFKGHKQPSSVLGGEKIPISGSGVPSHGE
jgi:vancomycin permeability regulator SanA